MDFPCSELLGARVVLARGTGQAFCLGCRPKPLAGAILQRNAARKVKITNMK